MNFRSFLLVFFISVQGLQAQDKLAYFDIDTIRFEGLEKTKSSFLYSTIESSKNGGRLNEALIEKDLQYLKNQTGVANAHYRIDDQNSNTELVFVIDERATSLPIINFGGIAGNIWFTLGAIDNNFGGNGNTALAYYQNNNGRHSGQLYFRNPRIKSSEWGYSFSLNKWSSIEPLYFNEGTVQYLYDNNGLSLTGIRNFGLEKQIEFGGNYFVETYTKDKDQELENPPGPERVSIDKFLTKIILKHNKLKYHFFYLEGQEHQLILQDVYNFSDASFFNSAMLQSKFFFRMSHNRNIAARFIFALSTNNDSPFAPFVADSHVNIRGVGNRIDRGTAQAIINLEMRRTVFDKKLWASQMVVFSDLGSWRSPGGSLDALFDTSTFRHFIGFGFRLIFEQVYGAVLRIDYGIDVYNTEDKGLVIGLGQYF